jgi:hypothetical protein
VGIAVSKGLFDDLTDFNFHVMHRQVIEIPHSHHRFKLPLNLFAQEIDYKLRDPLPLIAMAITDDIERHIVRVTQVLLAPVAVLVGLSLVPQLLALPRDSIGVFDVGGYLELTLFGLRLSLVRN